MTAFCPRCGAPRATGAVFCASCGLRLPEMPTVSPLGSRIDRGGAIASRSRVGTQQALIIAFAIVLAAIGGAAILVNGPFFRPAAAAHTVASTTPPGTAMPTPAAISTAASGAPAPATPVVAPATPTVGTPNAPLTFAYADGSDLSITVDPRPTFDCADLTVCAPGNWNVIVWVVFEADVGTVAYDASEFSAHDAAGNAYQLVGTSQNGAGTLNADAGSRATVIINFVVPAGTTALWLDWTPARTGPPIATWPIGGVPKDAGATAAASPASLRMSGATPFEYDPTSNFSRNWQEHQFLYYFIKPCPRAGCENASPDPYWDWMRGDWNEPVPVAFLPCLSDPNGSACYNAVMKRTGS